MLNKISYSTDKIPGQLRPIHSLIFNPSQSTTDGFSCVSNLVVPWIIHVLIERNPFNQCEISSRQWDEFGEKKVKIYRIQNIYSININSFSNIEFLFVVDVVAAIYISNRFDFESVNSVESWEFDLSRICQNLIFRCNKLVCVLKWEYISVLVIEAVDISILRFRLHFHFQLNQISKSFHQQIKDSTLFSVIGPKQSIFFICIFCKLRPRYSLL